MRGDGIILTNNHVVERAKEITVAMSDGKELPAKVLGRDPKTDLAVLKVESPTPLPIVPLGDSDRIAVGDWVVAIGNPFGLDNSVTAGIVSAKGRAIGQGPYDQFIQTDASINPGNSGGPLFDERGNVVGINTAIFSQSGGNIGIGFAIPVNVAKELVPQLEKDGHVTRGWLGVSIQKLTPELAESMGVGQKDGVLVGGITPDSPAAKAGLASGDVIQQWNGKAVDDPAALATAVAGTAVGKTVPVEVKRDGTTRTVEVTVDRMADDEQVAADASGAKRGRWGLAVRELTAEERREREMAGSEGVLVTGVAPDSPAAEAGIKEGDIVLQVNRAPVGSVAALRKAVEKTPSGKPLLLLVRTSEGGDRFAALAPGRPLSVDRKIPPEVRSTAGVACTGHPRFLFRDQSFMRRSGGTGTLQGLPTGAGGRRFAATAARREEDVDDSDRHRTHPLTGRAGGGRRSRIITARAGRRVSCSSSSPDGAWAAHIAGEGAIAADATTVYYNPAGMTLLPGTQFAASGFGVYTRSHFQNRGSHFSEEVGGGPIPGINGGNAGGFALLPTFFLTHQLMDRVSVGIGMSAPFGLETEWDRGWVGRYHARLSRLQTININPSIAVKVTDWMSVGAGANAEWANAVLSNNLDMGSLCQIFGAQQGIPPAVCTNLLGLQPGKTDGYVRLEGDDWAAGYNVGFLFTPRPGTRIGVTYRSRIKHTLTGDAGFTVPQKAEMLRTAVGRAGEHRRDGVRHAAGPRGREPLPGAAARPGLPGRRDVDELAAVPGARSSTSRTPSSPPSPSRRTGSTACATRSDWSTSSTRGGPSAAASPTIQRRFPARCGSRRASRTPIVTGWPWASASGRRHASASTCRMPTSSRRRCRRGTRTPSPGPG